jgi:hypothetical protein
MKDTEYTNYFIDAESAVEQRDNVNPLTYALMLGIIRRRRWYLWGLVLIYMPAAVLTLQLTQSYKTTGVVVLIWIVLLCIVVTLTAIAKCPRCGKTFHMRNSTLTYHRTCRYCGLHLCADRQST